MTSELTSAQLKTNIETLVSEIAESQFHVGRKMVQLGNNLLAVRSGKVWSEWGYQSFGAYIESLRSRVDKSRTQLYALIGVAEDLLPQIAEEKLEQMGIGKAMILRHAVKHADGKLPSEELLEKAVDGKVHIEEFEAAVAEEYQQRPENEHGTWYSFGGAYLTPEEKKELEYAFSVAERTDPVIPKETPDWARKKEIILGRFVPEYLAGHAAEVEGDI